MAKHAMKYGFSDEERKAFKEWLIKTDYIAAPQKVYTDERVFERQEVCRDYLEREELKVIASPFHRPDGKCCTKCGVWKPFAAFYPNGKGVSAAIVATVEIMPISSIMKNTLNARLLR